MKIIKLHCGLDVFVDDSDFEYLSKFSWYLVKTVPTDYHNRFRLHNYAYRPGMVNGKRRAVRMHREILGCAHGDGICVDHIDGNGLNNQKSNLRKCSNAENSSYRLGNGCKKQSRYKGVGWHKYNRLFRAYIKSETIGYFDDEVSAAKAYNKRAVELFGEFALLNEI